MEQEKRFPLRLPTKLYLALDYITDRQGMKINPFLCELIRSKLSTDAPETSSCAKNPFHTATERMQISVRVPAWVHKEFRKHCIDADSNMHVVIIEWLLQMPEIRDRLWSQYRIRVEM